MEIVYAHFSTEKLISQVKMSSPQTEQAILCF